ncbi:hypothetical protein VCHENC02_1614B, partial [Vibrio harveyi]
TINVITPICT